MAAEGGATLILALVIAAALVLLALVWLRGRRAQQRDATALADRQTELAALGSRLAAHEALLAERGRQLEGLRSVETDLRAELATARDAGEAARHELARLREAQEQVERQGAEKLALLQEAREQMTKEFKLLSAEILSKQGDSFAKQNEEKLTGLLDPLRRRIVEFQTSLETVQRESAKERAGLGQQIKSLADLGTRMNEETRNLTRALKGKSQTQGAWGEMILSSVLARSGLREGEEFTTQVSHSDESGQRLRPDVIVHLPNGERIVIDSKVSLTAYQLYLGAETPEERKAHLANHVRSLREHLRGLSAKGYGTIAGRGPEFVIMFLPIEEALSAALQANRELMDEALRGNIVLSTPTTLMVVLRTVHNLWTIDRRTRNVEEIAERGGLLYDKFVGFVEDMERLGQRMDQARSSYDEAFGKLKQGRGNLIGQADKLRSLGAKTKKQLPEDLLEDAGEPPAALTLMAPSEEKEESS